MGERQVRLISAEGFEFVVRVLTHHQRLASHGPAAPKRVKFPVAREMVLYTAFLMDFCTFSGLPLTLTWSTASCHLQIDYRAACVSNTIKSMLTSGGELSRCRLAIFASCELLTRNVGKPSCCHLFLTSAVPPRRLVR